MTESTEETQAGPGAEPPTTPDGMSAPGDGIDRAPEAPAEPPGQAPEQAPRRHAGDTPLSLYPMTVEEALRRTFAAGPVHRAKKPRARAATEPPTPRGKRRQKAPTRQRGHRGKKDAPAQ